LAALLLFDLSPGIDNDVGATDERVAVAGGSTKSAASKLVRSAPPMLEVPLPRGLVLRFWLNTFGTEFVFGFCPLPAVFFLLGPRAPTMTDDTTAAPRITNINQNAG
jgi:hypothetical protein